MHPTTIGTPSTPSLNISMMLKRIPKKMIPSRSSFFTAKVNPGVSQEGSFTTLLSMIPKRIAVITADIGDFSKPSSCVPAKSLIHILNQAKRQVKAKPGSRVCSFRSGTPKRDFQIGDSFCSGLE